MLWGFFWLSCSLSPSVPWMSVWGWSQKLCARNLLLQSPSLPSGWDYSTSVCLRHLINIQCDVVVWNLCFPLPPTAQTSAIDHHICLKSAESVAITRSFCDKTINHQQYQTYNNCYQGRPCCKFSPARFFDTLCYKYPSLSFHSSAFKQRSGTFL